MTAEQLSVDLDTGLENHYPLRNLLCRNYRSPPMPSYWNLAAGSISCSPAFKSNGTAGSNSPPTAIKVLAFRGGCETNLAGNGLRTHPVSSMSRSHPRDCRILLKRSPTGGAPTVSAIIPAPFAAILLPKDEQHSLMAYLTGAFFQAFGWQHQVLTHDQPSRQEFAGVVGRADAICIGWSNTRLRPQVRQLVDDIRLYAPDGNQSLIAGGVAALESVEFLVEMGIDCICDTAYSAVKIADNFNNLEKMDFVPPKVHSGH